ncbi:hypothetical protein GOP47_0005889 [Adiantum capillus-veneris]|uniref:Telomere-associated protein Rif1 N-terminal domain-containing protein n=1 Tax=Adiantum capillus-veneris TaxID=13818 RepID=A0A9D4ZJT7_ADICA|nr:hypothetical protein GOP47_0005889 [Adiantum capillus-veneris]
MGKPKEKLADGTTQHLELNPSELSVHYGNHGLLSAGAILKPILSNISSSDQDLVTLALRSLAYFLHNEKFIAEISDEKACAVLSSICQLIKSTDKTVLCSLALWCLGIQELKPKVVEASLDLILQSLLYLTDSGTSVSSKALIHQALQGFVKLAQKYSCARIKSSLWAPAIYRRLLSSDKKEREGAEQCMKDLEFMLLCRLKGDLSEVAAVDINETLLPKLEKMIKSKTSVLPAVRAWGWYIRLLGSLAGERRNLVNQMLKIVEVTFTSQDALVRNASLVAWEAIVDALLQLPNASGQQNTNINAGVSLSAGELEKPLLVLVPPLKRLKLLMVPFISIMSADKDQAVRLACWHTWHYLAHKLGTAINLPSVADIVVIPIFEAMFRFGPDKNHSSAWDLCIKALEDWICCKFKHKVDSGLSPALSINLPGKAPSPQTPTFGGAENVAESSCNILWTVWSLETLHVFLRLVKTLWSFSMEPSKNSCTRNLSLSGALRIFLLLVKGVESDGKCAVKPVKQHIDSVHSLLMFLDGVSCQHVETASMGEVLSAMDSLIESLLHLQPLVLSSSFYRISLAPMNFQKKFGEPFLKPDIGVGQEELTEVRTGDLVTPIVYLLHSWVTTASMKELSREERETFKKRLESLVVLAIRGFNVMGNLSGLASVLEFCLSESGRKRKADEANGTSVSNDTKATLGIFCIAPHSCVQLLLSWKTIAEHTAKYLEGSSDMFAVEGVASDSGNQVIFRILLFPLQVYLQLSSVTSADINKASLEVNLSGFAKALSDVDLQVVLIAWLKLFDCALSASSRMPMQANFFASGLSQQSLKLLEKESQQQGNKGACDGSNSFAEMVAFIAINVLKRTEISNLALLAINRKRRYGSFISTSGTSNGVCGSETETTSNVRNILVLASRVLDLSHDKYIAGQAYWLDSTARVLEELATFAARLNSQQDMLLFVQEFSKPFAKWLKFSESLHANQHNHCSTTVTYSLQKAWQELLYRLRKCHPPLSFDSNLLSLQALALAPAFQHSETSISSCTVSFWEATYGSWNRNGADASRRKSDVPYYTLTGRRCLQVFQELHMDAQNAPSGVSLPLPNMAKGGEDTSFQLGASSLPRSTCNLNTKATGMEQNAVPEKSLKVPRLSLSGHASMEASQAGSDSFHLANSSIFSEIGHCTGEKVKTSAALPMGGSLVVPKCSKAEVPVSSALLSAAAPRRKNRRFVDLKTYAYASNPVSEEGLIPFTKGQLERHMVKGVSEGDGNIMDTPRIVTVNNLLSVEGLNCSKDVGPSDTEKRILKRPRKRFVCELKKLGIRRQRFLRSSGSLRGGKFWRDTSGTVRALQKIRKGAAWLGAENSTTSKDSTDNKMVSVHEVRLVDEPSLVKQKEASAGESKLHVIGVERLPRKRGRPRRLGLANTDAPFHTMQSSNRLASVLNMEDACQQMQTSFEKDVDLGTSKFGNLLQKASPESPFRVQTLNRGLYSNIFSNVARRSDVVNSFASRSHHRKSSCPRRIPMSKDEQNENNQDFQDPHSNLKFKLRMSRRKLECQSGIEFTTPSKILRSGKKLKSKKWGTFSDASKVENKGLRNTPQKTISSDYSKSLRNCRATDWYHATVGKTMPAEPDLPSLKGSNFFPEFLQVADQPGSRKCESSKSLDLGGTILAQNEGQTLPHEHGVSSDGNESPSILIMLEKYGELGRRHRLCRRLADLSTSSEWNTMSLDDLECAQELLGNLQVLVGERKRCQLIGQAANMQQLLTYG